jgi:hypothetical protein
MTDLVTSGPKRDKVTGGWRDEYNEALHNLYDSLHMKIKLKEDEMGGDVARMGEIRNGYEILIEKTKSKEITWKIQS